MKIVPSGNNLDNDRSTSLDSSYLNKLIPIACVLLLGIFTVLFWQRQNSHEYESMSRHTKTSAEQIRIRMEGLMNTRLNALMVFANRWVEREPPDFGKERFVHFAQEFYGKFPGFQAINWIDPEGVIQWVYPQAPNGKSLGKSIYSDPTHAETFRAINENLSWGETPSVNLFDGGLGFHVFFPLIHQGVVQGYLDGVFEIETIMDICLPKDVLDGFRVSLVEEGRLVYSNVENERRRENGNAADFSLDMNFPNRVWTLHLQMKESLPTFRNLPLLGAGLFASIALSLLLYFFLQRMEMHRTAHNRALQELAERTRAEERLKENESHLKLLLEELSAKNTELETFVYTVSHDLKTPLVTIEGFIGALKEDFGEQITEDGERYLNYMSQATHKMESLINDLLELSRIGRVTEQRKRIPFDEIVQEVLANLSTRIEERGIEVNTPRNGAVAYGDRKRLLQAMENLISNAVKYIGKDNPSPRIEIGVENGPAEPLFYVRDNGIGIDEKYFEKVFGVFQRLPAAQEISEGTGVGLAIVKRIIEHHGGRIWIESVPGKGSTFYFTLQEQAQEA
jgi:signal transduction histidine kinase